MAENSHKVMLLIPNLQQGGAERQILELARKLPPRFAPVLCNRLMESISRRGMRSGSVSRRGGIADHETTRMGHTRSCLEA